MPSPATSNPGLQGIIIPAATAFDADERLDLDALASNFDRWRATDVAGYMVLGTNGEFRSLSDEESRVVVRHATRLKGDKTLVVGVGRESLHHTLEFLASLHDVLDEVDYISVLTPGYFAKLMDGLALADYYTAVADVSPVPVLVYVAPSYANGVLVPPATLAVLADHPNIAGVKDTSSSSMVGYMLAAGGRDDFAVLAGSLNTLMTALAFGGRGGVVSAANYLPQQCAHLVSFYRSGRQDEALAYYGRLQRLVQATGAAHGVAGLKACMDALGFVGGRPRLPVRPLGEAQRTAISEVFARDLEALDVSAPQSPL